MEPISQEYAWPIAPVTFQSRHTYASKYQSGSERVSKTSLVAGLLVCLCFWYSQVHGNESISAERTAAESAVEVVTPMTNAGDVPEPDEPLHVKILEKAVSDAPPIIRDATLGFNFRAYVFDKENTDNSKDSANALGGELKFVSGNFLEIARVGLSYYISEPVGDSENAGATGLVAPDGDGLQVLGQAFLELGHPGALQAAFGRRAYRIPYLSTDDSRMIPITQEAYVVARTGTPFDFGIGYFAKTKAKNSEDFVAMSEAAGAAGTSDGVATAWDILSPNDKTKLSVFNLYGGNTFNTLYVEANWADYLLQHSGIKVGAQYTDQRSVGDELVGDFRTWQAGLGFVGSDKSAILKLVHTRTGTGGSVRNPWGGLASYNNMMVESFNRPGEKAWRLTASLTGTPWNAGAWSGFASVIHGNDALDATTGLPAPDVTEVDLTLDYRPTSGPIKGLWVRVRGGYAEFEDSTSEWNARLIINYSMPML